MISDHEPGGYHALGPVVAGGYHAFRARAVSDQARDTLPTPVTSQTLETMDRVTPARPYCAHEETMKDHGPHSEGKTTGPKRVTPKAPIPPIVLMIGIRAHDGRPWETMGDHRPEARDTHPAPNGIVIPTVSDHERQGWEGVTRVWSPIMSAVGWVGVTRFGSAVSHGLRS